MFYRFCFSRASENRALSFIVGLMILITSFFVYSYACQQKAMERKLRACFVYVDKVDDKGKVSNSWIYKQLGNTHFVGVS